MNCVLCFLPRALLILGLIYSLSSKPSRAEPLVHPGDTLGVSVLNYASVIDDSQGRLRALNAGNVAVSAEGSISLPVVGTIKVTGRSTDAVAKAIEYRLLKYVRDPSVSVQLLQEGQFVFLTGATTGTLPFLPGETLSTALGQLREQLQKNVPSQYISQGDTYGGTVLRSAIDLRQIRIERDGQLGSLIDGDDLLRSGFQGPPLAPGDTLLFVSKPVRVEVKGQVATPGPVYLYPTDTLEKAVLAAGGPLPSASTVDASLVRGGQEIPLPLAGSTILEPPENGDTIVVRGAPHVTVLGQVPSPGELILKNGSTLLSALYVAGGPTRWANVRDIEVVHQGARRSFDISRLQYGDLSTNVPLSDGDVVYVPEGHKVDTRFFFSSFLGALSGAYNATHL